jgi:hypothetical protein
VARATLCLCGGCRAHAGSCGSPTLNGSRCLPCNRGFRRAVHNPAYDRREWRRHRTSTLRAHRSEHGDLCPGYRRPPHTARRLTVDHVDPLALGAELLGETQVLCDSCNTRKRWVQTPTRRVRRAR